jgi:hypothetical protein
MKKKPVTAEEKSSVGRTLWAYGYEMIPPHREDRMTEIRGLLDRENDEAAQEGRTWTARLVTEERVTHVLIVSASPQLDLEINRKLEAELKNLGLRFVPTVPMPVHDHPENSLP